MYFSLSKRFVLFVSKANLFFHGSINIKSFSSLWMKKQIKEVANCGIPDNKSLIKITRKTFRIVNLDRRSIEVLWHRLLLCRHRTGNCLWNSILQYFQKKRNCQKQQNWQKTEKTKFCLQYSGKRYRIIKVMKKGSPYLYIRRTFYIQTPFIRQSTLTCRFHLSLHNSAFPASTWRHCLSKSLSYHRFTSTRFHIQAFSNFGVEFFY